MKDPLYWLALAMAVVPFMEQAAQDPFVTSRPWLSGAIVGAIALTRFAYKFYNPSVKIPLPPEGTKTVVIDSDKKVAPTVVTITK